MAETVGGIVVATLFVALTIWAFARTWGLVQRRKRWWISAFACQHCGYRNAMISFDDPRGQAIECPECGRNTVMPTAADVSAQSPVED